jgi:hypothetical protein
LLLKSGDAFGAGHAATFPHEQRLASHENGDTRTISVIFPVIGFSTCVTP